MSMHEDFNTPGTRGHTRSTWRDKSRLRGLLWQLTKENPTVDDEELTALYVTAVETEAVQTVLHLCEANPTATPAEIVSLYIGAAKTLLSREATVRCLDNDLNMMRRPTRPTKRRTPTVVATPTAQPTHQPAAPEGQAPAAATQAREQEQPAATFTPPPRAKPQKLTAAEVVTMKAQIVKVVFLDLLMPNGKKLRHCTGLECKQMGGIFGAALNAVGALVGDELIVGDKLNEAEVAGIFASNTKAN